MERIKICKKPIQLRSSEDVAKLRKQILEKNQKGVCAICGRVPERPCLDHSHQKRLKGTGLIRGVLCSTCNSFIAKSENSAGRFLIPLKDLPKIFRQMAYYLEQPHYPYLHPSEKEKEKSLNKSSFKELQKAYSLKYPKRKPLEFPGSEKLTDTIKNLFIEFNIEPKLNKKTIKKRKRKIES